MKSSFANIVYEEIRLSSLYNFYATSEGDETSLHKAWTKSVGFFAVWTLKIRILKIFHALFAKLYGFTVFSRM